VSVKKINKNDFLKDLKKGVNDDYLMSKYGIPTIEILIDLFDKLILSKDISQSYIDKRGKYFNITNNPIKEVLTERVDTEASAVNINLKYILKYLLSLFNTKQRKFFIFLVGIFIAYTVVNILIYKYEEHKQIIEHSPVLMKSAIKGNDYYLIKEMLEYGYCEKGCNNEFNYILSGDSGYFLSDESDYTVYDLNSDILYDFINNGLCKRGCVKEIISIMDYKYISNDREYKLIDLILKYSNDLKGIKVKSVLNSTVTSYPIAHAFYSGKYKIGNLLLRKGNVYEPVDRLIEKPVNDEYLTDEETIKVLMLSMKSGLNINNKYLLGGAVAADKKLTIAFLINKNVPKNDYSTMFDYIYRSKHDYDVLKMIFKYGVNINGKDSKGVTALEHRVSNVPTLSADIVKQLQGFGATIDYDVIKSLKNGYYRDNTRICNKLSNEGSSLPKHCYKYLYEHNKIDKCKLNVFLKNVEKHIKDCNKEILIYGKVRKYGGCSLLLSSSENLSNYLNSSAYDIKNNCSIDQRNEAKQVITDAVLSLDGARNNF